MPFLEVQLGKLSKCYGLIGCEIVSLPVVDSTNAYLQRGLLVGFLREGVVVTARQQTEGKGQRGTHWRSQPDKNILMSVLLCPVFLEADKQFLMSIAIALGVSDFVMNLLPENRINVKWPNDILVEEKKVGGILIENSIQGNAIKNAIVGIGINVGWAPEEDQTSWPVASLSDFGISAGPSDLLTALCEALDKRYSQLRAGKHRELCEEYLRRLYGIGEERVFKDLVKGEAFVGRITGLDTYGRLQVEQERGVKEYSLKEIGFVR